MNFSPLEIAIVFAWGILAIFCGWVADKRGRPYGWWMVLGFVNPIIVLILLLILPDESKKTDDPEPEPGSGG